MVTPSGSEVELGYLSPCLDGFVLGVPKIEGTDTSHLTIIQKEGMLSSHITPQDNSQKERKYFPKLNLGDFIKAFQEKAEKNIVIPVPTDKLLEDVFYITQKFVDWMDFVWSTLSEKRTSSKEIIHVLNFKKLVERIPQLVKELKKSPSSFFGICKTKEILEDSSKIFGITESKLLVMDFENQLYYVDFSSLLNFNPVLEKQELSTPLSELYNSMGINQYMQEVEEKKILDKLLSKT